MKTQIDKKYVLPGTIIEVSKFFELANKYLKTIVRKHTKNWGVDILELLSFLSKEKSPAISGGESYFSDNEYLGRTWKVGSLKAVKQSEQTEQAAYDVINILRKYREVERVGEALSIEPLRDELDTALEKYVGINTNIYFLFDKASNSIKVGRSTSVNKRVKNLQTGSPNKLKLIYQCPARTAWDILIKRELKRFRIRDEWFKAEKEVFKFILWLKYIQDNNLNSESVSREKYDDNRVFNREFKKLIKEV